MNKRKKATMRAAKKAPRWVRDIAAAKYDPAAEAKYRKGRLGTFGPASEVRKIDPADHH